MSVRPVSAELPVRHPDTRSPRVMTRRAWWLVTLNVLIPGSAQVLAGSRRLGRFGLATTLVWWLLVAGAVVTADEAPENPSWQGQRAQAWTQPVGWKKALPGN